jgi:hypothetical protein
MEGVVSVFGLTIMTRQDDLTFQQLSTMDNKGQ